MGIFEKFKSGFKKSAEAFAGPDAQEGIAAFLEKRDPKWD